MAETDSRILEYLEEGLFLYGVGKVQESIVRWRKVLELDPRNERAMDYIESAGGDVSQFRQKVGQPTRPAGTPVVSPPPVAASAPPPAAVATLPMPNVTAPKAPLDVGAFLESTGTAPPMRGAAAPMAAPTAPPPPRNGPMPWQQPPQAAPAMPSLTTSDTANRTQPAVPVAPPVAPVFKPPVAPPPTPPIAFAPPPQPAVVAPPTPPPTPTPVPVPAQAAPNRAQLIAQAGTLFQSRNFEQSLELLERIAREHPPVDEALRQYLDAARNALYEVLKTQWPRPDLIPEIRMNAAQVMQLKLSPEAGFIFSRIDGVSTVEEILSMGGLDPFTTLRALSQLLRVGVIGVQA